MTTIFHLVGNHDRIGGIISTLESLIESTTPSSGVEHRVLMHQDFPGSNFAFPENLDFVPGFLDDSHNHFRMLAGALRALPATRALLSRAPHPILHSHTRGGMLLGSMLHKLFNTPLVFTHHCYGKNKARYSWRIDHPNIRHVYLTNHMLDYYGANNQPNACIASESVSPSFGGEPSPKPSNDNQIRFLGLGSIVSRKRWHQIPEALSLLPPSTLERVRVDLYGDSIPSELSYHDTLLADIRERNLDQHIQVHPVTTEVPRLLAESDWYLFPSVLEPCSLTLIEALASGLPVIGARSGGTPEIVNAPEGGILFDADNVKALADAIHAAVEHPPPIDRKTLPSLVENRRAPRVLETYLEIYHGVRQAAYGTTGSST